MKKPRRKATKEQAAATGKSGRLLYYVPALILSFLAIVYCVAVFVAGRYEQDSLGAFYLIGTPTYYFFYPVVLPFIAAGVLCLGFRNTHIRFFGGLSDTLKPEHRNKVYQLRKVLLGVALLLSVLVTILDAGDKSYALPPFAFAFSSVEAERGAAHAYGCAKNWIEGTECASTAGNAPESTALPNDERQRNGNGAAAYFAKLKAGGIDGHRYTGFDSLASWYSQSSWLYKFESFLSLLGAMILGAFFAQVCLLVIVKDYARSATKNLMIWMIVLASLWFPVKLFSAWYFGMGEPPRPAVFWFGLLLLVVVAALVIFIRTEKNELYKYAGLVGIIVSAAISSLTYFSPKTLGTSAEILRSMSWGYGVILLLVVGIALYFMTDYLISSYEQEEQAG